MCLKTGAACTARLERQYAKYGFRCESRLLGKPRKTTPPAPAPVTTTPTVPSPPPNPFLGTWYAIDPTDNSVEQVTFEADGSLTFHDSFATTCGGVAANATAVGAPSGNVWTASRPTTLLCPDNQGSVANVLFQFTLNADGTLTGTGTPDRWTRTKPA